MDKPLKDFIEAFVSISSKYNIIELYIEICESLPNETLEYILKNVKLDSDHRLVINHMLENRKIKREILDKLNAEQQVVLINSILKHIEENRDAYIKAVEEIKRTNRSPKIY